MKKDRLAFLLYGRRLGSNDSDGHPETSPINTVHLEMAIMSCSSSSIIFSGLSFSYSVRDLWQ